MSLRLLSTAGLLVLGMALSACGGRVKLKPQEGASMPVKPEEVLAQPLVGLEAAIPQLPAQARRTVCRGATAQARGAITTGHQ